MERRDVPPGIDMSHKATSAERVLGMRYFKLSLWDVNNFAESLPKCLNALGGVVSFA